VVVFHDPNRKATEPGYRREVEDSLARIASRPQVKGIDSYYNTSNPRMVSTDGHSTYALASLSTNIDESYAVIPEIRQQLKGTSLKTWITGGIAIFADVNSASERDLQRSETAALPLVLVALVLVFGSLVAAGIPLVMGLLSVSVTLAALYFIGHVTDVSIFALNITTFLGLGIAIDYSLFVVGRYREEARSRGWGKDTIGYTMASAGMAITFSAVTTILGLSGLLLFQFMMLRSIGLGGIGVVFISLLMALTLMPAILSVLGRRVNALPIIPQRAERGGFWAGLAQRVMRYPYVVLVPVLLLLLVLGSPFLRVKLGTPWAKTLPPDMESRLGWEHLERSFGEGELSPISAVITSEKGIFERENLDALYRFTRKLQQDGRVTRVESIVNLSPEISKEQYAALYSNRAAIPFPEVHRALSQLAKENTTLVRVISKYPVNSDDAKGLVRDIRPMRMEGDLRLKVTGGAADLMDTVDLLYRDFPRAIVFIVITTYIALLVLFRSMVLPLKAILMNILSITASYGALVFIFQEGHFQGLLNFTAEGFTEATVPILLFCILFGLSMDYEVFLLSRIKESYDASRDNTASVAQGLERIGRIITSAALVLVLVAGSFTLADIVIVKSLGFATALAILIDATIVRALLVPSVMRVMGDFNWWAPRAVKAIIPEVRRLP